MSGATSSHPRPNLPIGGIRLEPCLQRRAWGGTRLASMRASALQSPGDGPFGESWELADLPGSAAGNQTRVRSAEHLSISELLATHASPLLGRSRRREDGRFPLLLKHLDAATPLSVQCHPSPDYEAEHPETSVKHEGWFVLDAEPGAVVHRGFRRHLDRAEIDAAIAEHRLHRELVAEPIAAGDFVWLPSGTCHALGGGLLVAEVQTPSDTTFRVYDWDRDDPNRPLHLEETRLAVAGTAAADLPPIVHTASTPPLLANGFRTWPLHQGEWFDIELIEADAGTRLPVVTNGVAVAWMVLEGAWRSLRPGSDPAVNRGVSTVLWPAEGGEEIVEFTEHTRFLRIPLAEEKKPSLPQARPGDAVPC